MARVDVDRLVEDAMRTLGIGQMRMEAPFASRPPCPMPALRYVMQPLFATPRPPRPVTTGCGALGVACRRQALAVGKTPSTDLAEVLGGAW
eukprot:14695795-Heterocapsa_arctica.AAC.1